MTTLMHTKGASRKGRYHVFPSKVFLSHSAGKKLIGTVPCSNEILVMKTFKQRRGVVTFFRIFLQKVPKIS